MRTDERPAPTTETMTDNPGHPPLPEPNDGPDETGPADSRSGTPERDFDAVFEGESWDSPRRRRSEDPTPGTSPDPSERAGHRRSSSGSSRSRSRGRSRASSGPASTRPGAGNSRRVRSILVHAVLGVLGLGLAWIVVTGLLAAYQLEQARSDLTALRSQITSGDDSLTQTAQDLSAHAHHAAVLTRGPAWALAASIPYVGDPFDAVRGITSNTATLVDDAAPGLIAVAADVNPRTVVNDGVIDIPALQRAADPVADASAAAAAADTAVSKLPHSTWLPFVDTATTDLAGQLHSLDHTLRTTNQALQVLPTMLGGDGTTKRYFLAFQNNAELRGSGGLPGAFAIVTATDGKISIEKFLSDTALATVPSSGLDFGKAYDQQYEKDQAYSQYIDSNLSPNFPYAAQIWCSMWQNASGEKLDGALTIDPGALSYLLAATGPAKAPDGVQVSADNVVALLQKDVYAKFPAEGEIEARKTYILGIAEAAEKKILAGTKNNKALLQGLARAVSERRIVAWSSNPDVAAVLAQAPIGGTIAPTAEPYSMLVVNNGAGGKLDYYLDRKVTWTRTGCGDSRDVTVTIQITNTAPASGLPPYVSQRVTEPGITPPADLVPGQNRAVVSYLATKGAGLLGATLDGQASGAEVFDEEGHPSFRTIVEIKPGQTITWVLKLQEAAGDQPVTVVRQPAVTPLDMTVDDRSCR